MSLHISAAGLDALQRGWQQAPAFTQSTLLGAMTEATMLVEREVKERVPRGATGLTAASVTSDAFSTPAGVLGVVSSAHPAAQAVELGTRPHMPPVDALVPWVQVVLGVEAPRARSVAFLVARKIARKGTRAQRPFGLAIVATEGQVVRMFEDAAAKIVAHLAGAAA